MFFNFISYLSTQFFSSSFSSSFVKGKSSFFYSKWNQEEVKIVGFPFFWYRYNKENKTTFEKKSDSPIQRVERTREKFVLVRSRRTRHRNLRLTSLRWENKHMSNMIIDVDCWTPTDRQNFPTANKTTTVMIGVSRDTLRWDITKWIIPAAVNHTDIKIETSCAKRMELDVLRIFKYWRMSGTLMSRSARRKRRPNKVKDKTC